MNAPTKLSAVTLRQVSKETVREICALKVAPEQQHFVAPNAFSIAQAYFEADAAWFRAIYADDVPIGFVMLADNPAKPEYVLWRFMIDARFQGLGLGKRALALVIEHVKSRPEATELLTSCEPGEGSPGAFYEKAGFAYTGEVDDGELVMRLAL